MDMKVYVEGKSKNQLLNELGGSEPASTVFELQKAGILVRCTEDVEKQMAELGRLMTAAATKLTSEVTGLTSTIISASQSLRGQVHELDGTIRDANRQNETLQGKLLFLNVILTVATVVAAVATALEAWKAFHAP
jgi:hypothetical protein